MAGIKSTGTKSTEEIFQRLLENAGIEGWEIHNKDLPLPGKPDFIFRDVKVVVFIDGCFWHGCPYCSDGHIPNSNKKYWSEKILRNKQRDRKNSRILRQIGWSVIRIWECRLKRNPNYQMNRVIRKIQDRDFNESRLYLSKDY